MNRAWLAGEEDLAEAAEVCSELGRGPVLQRMPAGLGQDDRRNRLAPL